MENNEERNCRNCKYFQKLYIKKNTFFFCVDERCFHPQLIKTKLKNRNEPRENCDRWEDDSCLREERLKSIKNTLRDMQKSLKQIAQILKDDE